MLERNPQASTLLTITVDNHCENRVMYPDLVHLLPHDKFRTKGQNSSFNYRLGCLGNHTCIFQHFEKLENKDSAIIMLFAGQSN